MLALLKSPSLVMTTNMSVTSRGTPIWRPRVQYLNLGAGTCRPTAKIYVHCWKFHTHVGRRNSLLKCVSQPEIAKNLPKPLILVVQGHLRSLMLLALKSSSTMLVMISRMSVPICNCLYATQAIGKVINF